LLFARGGKAAFAFGVWGLDKAGARHDASAAPTPLFINKNE